MRASKLKSYFGWVIILLLMYVIGFFAAMHAVDMRKRPSSGKNNRNSMGMVLVPSNIPNQVATPSLLDASHGLQQSIEGTLERIQSKVRSTKGGWSEATTKALYGLPT